MPIHSRLLSPYYYNKIFLNNLSKDNLIKFLNHNSKVFKLLNIHIKSKPVLLFLLSISSSSLIFIIYNLVKLVNYLKINWVDRKKINKANFYRLNNSNSNARRNNNVRIVNVPYKNSNLKVRIDRINYDKYEHDKLIFKKFIKENDLSTANTANNPSNNIMDQQFHSNWIESKFLKKVYVIWRLILIPNFFHKNTTILLSQIACLVARTWLSLLVTKLDGQIVRDLIGLKGRAFLRSMVYWFLFAFPASYINSGISYLTKRLALNFRTNLIRYCHDLYMDSRLVYYKMQFNNNQLPDYQIDFNYIDQYLTEDIKKFSDSLTSLFSNVGKPSIDLIFFAIYLRDNIGSLGIMGILLNYLLTGYILKIRSPNFNKIWKYKSHLEGIYYNYNLNLINNSEEISFYKGIKIEKHKVLKIFNNLLSHLSFEINSKFNYELLEEYILKYVWPAFSYIFSSLPILFDYTITESSSSPIKNFIVNKRLMLSMADAGSRLMYSIKDISRLSGVTDRIFTLLVNLHQVHDLNFQYGLNNSLSAGNNQHGFGSLMKLNSFASFSKTQLYINQFQNNCMINGTIQNSYNGLRFEKIPVIVPSSEGGDLQHALLKNLTFKINKNDNLLILGKNGIGKSSVIKLIGELWPLYSGLLSKPSNNDIMIVSQKSYFINGSLRDQIIYPLNHLEMLEKGVTDEDLIEYLNEVGLDYLLDRFDNLDYNPSNDEHILTDELIINGELKPIYNSNIGLGDGKKSWLNLLSGGERQKLIIARILFHKKQFVILDEPTNAISYDSEDMIFEMLKRKGFTLITISHRDSLIKYHDYLLELGHFDNGEDFQFGKIDEGILKKFENVDNEIEFIKQEVEKLNTLRKRKEELRGLLDGYEE